MQDRAPERLPPEPFCPHPVITVTGPSWAALITGFPRAGQVGGGGETELPAVCPWASGHSLPWPQCIVCEERLIPISCRILR